MNLIEEIIVNLFYFVIKVIKFIDSSSILSGLVITLIVAIFLTFILRTPNFTLTLETNMIPGTNEGQTDFILKNNKRFQYYNKGEIYFHFYIPTRIIAEEDATGRLSLTKVFFKDNGQQTSLIRDPNYEFKHRIPSEDGEEYFELRGVVDSNVFPERTVPVLSIRGQFNKNEDFKVYYWFSTKYGNFPRYIKYNGIPFYKKLTTDNLKEIRDNLPHAEPDVAEIGILD
ncbi:MAG: hypothetical protein WC619_05750 [Patescibacteria group bacterium]